MSVVIQDCKIDDCSVGPEDGVRPARIRPARIRLVCYLNQRCPAIATGVMSLGRVGEGWAGGWRWLLKGKE